MERPTNTVIPQKVMEVNCQAKTINYLGESFTIENWLWDDVLAKITPYWTTDRDVLQFFYYYDTGYFYLQKRKYVLDFVSKEYVWKNYEWREDPENKLDELLETFKEVWFQTKTRLLEYKQSKQRTDSLLNVEYNWKYVRFVRSYLLQQSDWVFTGDSQVSEEDKEKWLKYRQYLRDVTENQNDPDFDLLNLKIPYTPRQVKLFDYINSDAPYMEDSTHYYHIREMVYSYQELMQTWVANVSAFSPIPPTPQLPIKMDAYILEDGSINMGKYEEDRSRERQETLDKILLELGFSEEDTAN